MKRILLATTAVVLMSLPAAAQGMNNDAKSPHVQSNPPVQGGQSYDMNATQSGSDQRPGATRQPISHQALSQDEIARIQQALNKQGFDAGNVDGIWGPETRAALRNFQERQSLQASGALDQQTLDALGVNVAQGSASEPSATTGAGSSAGSSATTGTGAATTGSGANSSGSSTDPRDGKGSSDPAAASGGSSGMSGGSSGSSSGSSGSGGSQ
jgi:peptidoglycan hydrolase-like protein with peptidoglycan-binding domain